MSKERGDKQPVSHPISWRKFATSLRKEARAAKATGANVATETLKAIARCADAEANRLKETRKSKKPRQGRKAGEVK